jgi:hypothetical protein
VQNTVLTRLSTKAKNLWRLWAKALGEKAGATDQEADKIALVRTFIVLTYIITNLFIIIGVIRHW